MYMWVSGIFTRRLGLSGQTKGTQVGTISMTRLRFSALPRTLGFGVYPVRAGSLPGDSTLTKNRPPYVEHQVFFLATTRPHRNASFPLGEPRDDDDKYLTVTRTRTFILLFPKSFLITLIQDVGSPGKRGREERELFPNSYVVASEPLLFFGPALRTCRLTVSP